MALSSQCRLRKELDAPSFVWALHYCGETGVLSPFCVAKQRALSRKEYLHAKVTSDTFDF